MKLTIALMFLATFVTLGGFVMALKVSTRVPREYPLWCHNWEHEELSGVCSKVKGLEWSI